MTGDDMSLTTLPDRPSVDELLAALEAPGLLIEQPAVQALLERRHARHQDAALHVVRELQKAVDDTERCLRKREATLMNQLGVERPALRLIKTEE